jgi:hypothetical protein
VEIADKSPFEHDTIINDKWVASRYELSSRDDTLSFTHHRLAAPLEDRLAWLATTRLYVQFEANFQGAIGLTVPAPGLELACSAIFSPDIRLF